MPRFVYPSNKYAVRPVTHGGTGGKTAEQASVNLGFIPRNMIGQPGGVAGYDPTTGVGSPLDWTNVENKPTTLIGYHIEDGLSTSMAGQPFGLIELDNNGKVPMSSLYTGVGGLLLLNEQGQLYDESLPPELLAAPTATIDGPASLASSTAGTYTITNFDAYTVYTLTAISGSVSRSGATITYTAPASSGVGGFLINGRRVQVTITASGLVTPSVTSPTNGATGISLSPSFAASVFAYFGTAQTHAQSEWQLSATSSFASTVATYTGSANLTTWTPAATLVTGTTYYVRVRYLGSGGNWSNWSTTNSFTVLTFQGWAVTADFAGGTYTNGPLVGTAIDSMGNIFTLGQINNSMVPDLHYENMTSLMKWTPAGTIAWQKRTPDTAVDKSAWATPITTTVDKDGLVYSCAHSVWRDSANLLSSQTGINLAKFDNGGNLVWERKYTSPTVGVGSVLRGKIVLDSAKNIFLIRADLNTASPDTRISKLDQTGNVLWELSTSASAYVSADLTTDDSYLYLCGLSGSAAMMKINAQTGALTWKKQLTLPSNGVFNDCVIAGSSVIAVGNYGNNGLIAAISSVGDLIWSKNFTVGAGTTLTSIVKQSNNTLIIVGKGDFSIAGNDGFVIAIDTNGTILWQRRITSANDDAFYDVAVNQNGQVYASGYFLNKPFLVALPATNVITNGAMAGLPAISWANSAITFDGTAFATSTPTDTPSTINASSVLASTVFLNTNFSRVYSTY